MLLSNLLKEYASDEDTAIRYLINEGVINENKRCPNNKCRKLMPLNIKRKAYKCNNYKCKKEKSIFTHTFFSESNLPVNKILEICYLFLNKMPTTSIISVTGIQSESVCNWISHTRSICADMVDFEDVIIGGEGIVVEVDETKLGKRKYHRGHWVEGVWVLVGVERTAEKKIFCVELPDRSAETIGRIVKEHVLPGSIVNTDGWAAYNLVCEENELEHNVVNHKYNFKDPLTGTHTNTVEGINNGLKISLCPQNRTKKILKIIYIILYGKDSIKKTFGKDSFNV